MKIGFIGHESKGTWQIRARQIAPYLNADLDSNMNNLKYDLVILIKTPSPDLINRIKQNKIPVVWDVVDFWPQRIDRTLSNLNKDQIMNWVKPVLGSVDPKHIITATNTMKIDFESLGYKNCTTIYHHHRPKIKINPINKLCQTIGIEGSIGQYGSWIEKLKIISKKLHMKFTTNHSTLDDLLHTFDIVIAQRDFTGYAPKNWKSNIKLANAHASGTPGIFNTEQGYKETACGYEFWADTVDEIVECIEKLRSYDLRQNIHENFLKNTISIEQVIEQYKSLINKL